MYWIKRAGRLKRCMQTDIHNMAVSRWFLLAVAGSLLLMLISRGYYDNYGRAYSIVGLLFSGEVPEAAYTQVSVQGLLSEGPGGNIYYTFANLCFGLPFVMYLSTERSSGYTRFVNYHAGTGEYVVSKAAAGMLCAGFTALISYLLFAGVVLSAAGVRDIYGGFTSGMADVLKEALRMSAACFLYGVFSMGWIYPFAAWIKDKYVLLSLPFLCRYLYLQFLFHLSEKLILEERIGDKLTLISRLSPNSVLFGWRRESYPVDCIARLIILLCVTAVWLLFMKRRLDRGE